MQQQTRGSEQKSRENRNLSASGSTLSMSSFPPSNRPDSHEPEPPFYIAQPQDIAEGYIGKFRRDALHSVVHAFREAFGFDNQAARGYTPGYLAAVRRFQRISPGHPQEKAIRLLSSPRGYLAVRQAGRMRASYDRLHPGTLRPLCREIRAALVWRSKYR